MRIWKLVVVGGLTAWAGLNIAGSDGPLPSASTSQPDTEQHQKTSLDYWRDAEVRKSGRSYQGGQTVIPTQLTLPVTAERLSYERSLFTGLLPDNKQTGTGPSSQDAASRTKESAVQSTWQEASAQAKAVISKQKPKKKHHARPQQSPSHYAQDQRPAVPSFFW